MKEEKITINLREYKDLLVIKGKYDELKNNQSLPPPIYPSKITFPDDKNKLFEFPYEVTCDSYIKNGSDE